MRFFDLSSNILDITHKEIISSTDCGAPTKTAVQKRTKNHLGRTRIDPGQRSFAQLVEISLNPLYFGKTRPLEKGLAPW